MRRKKRFSLDIDFYKVLQDDPFVSVLRAYIVCEGHNPNKTYFTKESIEQAMPTLANKPILAIWDGINDFKEHAKTLSDIKNQDAIGTIPESGNFSFEEYEGKEYLATDIVIWKNYFPHMADKLNQNDAFSKISMEIFSEKETKRQDGYAQIDKFMFAGIAVLGAKYGTGIPNAHMKMVKYSSDEYGKLVEDTNVKFSAIIKDGVKVDNLEKDVQEVNEPKLNTYGLTSSQTMQLIEAVFADKKYMSGDYEYRKYWVNDYDDEYVYVYDCEDDAKKRMKMTIADMTVSVDFESAEMVICGKPVPVAFAEQEQEEKQEDAEQKEFSEENEEKEEEKQEEQEEEKEDYACKYEEMSCKYAELEKQFAEMQSENEGLKQFKSDVERKEEETKMYSVLDGFKSILSEEESKEYVAKIKTYSFDVFETEINKAVAQKVKFITENKSVESQSKEDGIQINFSAIPVVKDEKKAENQTLAQKLKQKFNV